jgi:hypothetical protein
MTRSAKLAAVIIGVVAIGIVIYLFTPQMYVGGP